MEKRNLVDAGPVIALLIAGDRHHAWAREVWGQPETARVPTTDSDFRIYRRNRRQIIPLLAPPGI